jgi:hypothetical protein
MRIHPLSLALRYLKGQRKVRGAPYYGQPAFASEARLFKFSGSSRVRTSAQMRCGGVNGCAEIAGSTTAKGKARPNDHVQQPPPPREPVPRISLSSGGYCNGCFDRSGTLEAVSSATQEVR